MVRKQGSLVWVLAIVLGFGFALMGCATTEQLKAVDDKVTAAGAKADKALSESQAAKAQATDAAAKAGAAEKKATDAADQADKAAARAEKAAKDAEMSAAKAAEVAKKCEAIFMKRMKK
jgi:murein lipoprotein